MTAKKSCFCRYGLITIIIASILRLSVHVTFYGKLTGKHIIANLSSVATSANLNSITISADLSSLNLYGYGKNTNMILTFVNIDYFDVFEKWFAIFNKTVNDDFENNLLLLSVCFDDEVFDKISEINHININTLAYKTKVIHIKYIEQCYQHNTAKIPLNLIWKYRLCVLNHLFESNDKQTLNSLILTDIDAYWLKNPYKYFNTYSFIDIMATGGIFPSFCQLRSNIDKPSALCMGFIFFNNTLTNKHILAEAYNKCKQENHCDNQIVVNCLLTNITNKYSLKFIENNTELVDNNINNINIHYLPHKYFCRYNCTKIFYNNKNQLYIAHPLSGKNPTQKIKIFAELFHEIQNETNNFDLAFVHIPKNAGSTIEDVLHNKFNINVGRFAYKRKNGPTYEWCRCPKWHCPLSCSAPWCTDRPLSRYFQQNISYFAVVRNPFNRYISEYQYCYGMLECWKQLLRNIGFEWASHDFCDKHNFNRVTSIIFKGLLNDKISWNIENCHFVPQYNFIYYKQKKLIKYVLKFENFSNEFIDLLQLFIDTKNIVENDLNNSLYLTNRPAKKCLYLTINDINETNKQLIRQYYVNDFKYFYQTEHRIN